MVNEGDGAASLPCSIPSGTGGGGSFSQDLSPLLLQRCRRLSAPPPPNATRCTCHSRDSRTTEWQGGMLAAGAVRALCGSQQTRRCHASGASRLPGTSMVFCLRDFIHCFFRRVLLPSAPLATAAFLMGLGSVVGNGRCDQKLLFPPPKTRMGLSH